MKKINNLASIVTICAASVAFGEKPAPTAKPTAAAPDGAKTMPQPPAELDQLGIIGAWTCDGKGKMSSGEMMTMKSTYEITKGLNGFVLVGHVDIAEIGYKGVDYYNYDAATKTFVMTSFDNFGTTATATAKAMKGNRQEWNGNGKVTGKDVKMQTTIIKKSDREMLLIGVTTGKRLKNSMEFTCKK